MYAHVIRRAVVDHALYAGHSSEKLAQIGGEADNWLFKDNQDFFDLCDILDINPQSLRNGVLTLTEQDARSLRGLAFDGEQNE